MLQVVTVVMENFNVTASVIIEQLSQASIYPAVIMIQINKQISEFKPGYCYGFLPDQLSVFNPKTSYHTIIKLKFQLEYWAYAVQ